MTEADPTDFQLAKMLSDWPAHNFHSYSAPRSVNMYASLESLLPAEAVVFAKYAAILAGASVLDIGVGGGRTTKFLKAQCRAYKAVDYSPAMIEACRKSGIPRSLLNPFRFATRGTCRLSHRLVMILFSFLTTELTTFPTANATSSFWK